MTIPRTVAYALACLQAIATVTAQTSKPTPDLAARLHRYLQKCRAHGWMGSALVAKEGRFLVRAGYGYADPASKRRNTADTLFEIASATKQFTAAAILKLEEQGKLDTADPIAKYLPGVPERCSKITIYHLLTHTSGMPRMAVGGHGADLEAAVKAFLRTGPVRQPDVKHEYWNGGYALLAGVVEKAGGTDYMTYCRRNLFEPAGLEHTGFTGDEDLGAPEAVGYNGTKRLRSALEHPYGSYGWQYRGMGGAVTTVNDLYRWTHAILGDKVLGDKAKDKLFKVYLGKYACGWYVVESTRKTRKITHGGDVRGFHTQYMHFPEDGATIIVTSNVEGVPMWAISYNLESLLFGTPLRYPEPPALAKLTADDLQNVAGTFQLSDTDHLVVRRHGEGLRVGGVGRATVALLMANGLGRVARRRSFQKEEELAAQLMRGIAGGDVALLAKTMHRGIPRNWPDNVKNRYWPKQVDKLGAFKSLRIVDATATRGNGVQILVELSHEKGRGHTRIVLVNGRLTILDLNGPEFAATLDFRPTAKDRFVNFNWLDKSDAVLTMERDRNGQVVALALRTRDGKSSRARKAR